MNAPGKFRPLPSALRNSLILAALWVSTSQTAHAQDRKPDRQLVVSSTATVHVKPDSARMQFFVLTESPNKAREENDKQVKLVRDKLTALGFAGVEIQTVPYAIGSVTAADQVPVGVPPPKLQLAQTGFVVVVHEKNLAKLGDMAVKLADTASENGATPVDKLDDPLSRLAFSRTKESSPGPKIEWLRKDQDDARRDAIRKALANARINAEAALPDKKLVLTTIRISNVEHAPSYRYSVYDRTERLEVDVPVSVEVTVTYTFE